METRRPTTPAAEEILGLYHPVLDHGFVSLVDYMGSDESIEHAARVSYGYGTRKRSATRGLIRYLRRHLHTTPSEMVELKFHCAMPMFVARQWVRHRTASINEYSGRYSLMPLLFYRPDPGNFSLQSSVNNQGREADAAPERVYRDAIRRWEDVRASASRAYAWMIQEDVARELARIDLPLSTYTQWYWKIDLHNLLHFLTLRVDDHAQWEIQEFGRVMAGMLKRVAPLSFEAWIDYQVCGDKLSRMEIEALARLLEPTEDGGLQVRGDRDSLGFDELRGLGMAPREIRELTGKIRPRPVPDFDLDLSRFRSAEEVAAEMHEAVPGNFE
jgi:thymidylate synthase (FAD)